MDLQVVAQKAKQLGGMAPGKTDQLEKHHCITTKRIRLNSGARVMREKVKKEVMLPKIQVLRE